MNNYQLNLLNRGKFEFVSELGNEVVELNDALVLHQNGNYKIGGYKIIVNNSMVDGVLYQNKKYSQNTNGLIEIPFDFDKPGNEIVLSFKGGIADDCQLALSLVLANHEAFDIKEAKENQEQLNNNISLVLTKGNSLINIYFKKANDNVVKTILKVFFYENDKTYLVEESENNGEFKSITGLGYGSYVCYVEQYDAKDKLVAFRKKSISLTDEIASLKSSLEKSLDGVKSQVRASGRNTVSW